MITMTTRAEKQKLYDATRKKYERIVKSATEEYWRKLKEIDVIDVTE